MIDEDEIKSDSNDDKEKINLLSKCSRGHRLKKETVKKGANKSLLYNCDLCGNSIDEGHSMYSCDDCKYDLCYSCIKKEKKSLPRDAKKNVKQDLLTDMKTEFGTMSGKQLYEVKYSKKNEKKILQNVTIKNHLNEITSNLSSNDKIDTINLSNHATKTRMDWFDNLEELVKTKAIELLSQGIKYYDGLKEQVFTDMQTEHGILPTQTQQLYKFLYLTKNIDEEDNASQTTDATNTKDIIRDMEGRLISPEGKVLEFEVKIVKIKNKEGKHFIRYKNNYKPEAEWLTLDSKNFKYTSYGKKWIKGWYQGEILSLTKLDGSVIEKSLNLVQPVYTINTETNQAEELCHVHCLEDIKNSEGNILSLKNADESEFNVYQSVIENALNLQFDTKDTDKNQDGITNVRCAVKKSSLKDVSSNATFFTPNDLVTKSTISVFEGLKNADESVIENSLNLVPKDTDENQAGETKNNIPDTSLNSEDVIDTIVNQIFKSI